jgi:hypothetical protein
MSTLLANHWWLKLQTPEAGTHMYFLGVGYDNETGFQDLINQASAAHDFPDGWYDLYAAGESYYRGVSEDPPASFFDSPTTVHQDGWAEAEE